VYFWSFFFPLCILAQNNKKKIQENTTLASNRLNGSFLLFLRSGLKEYKGHYIPLKEESQSFSFTRWWDEKHHPGQWEAKPHGSSLEKDTTM